MNKRNLRRRLKNKRGFTLVELVVAMLLMAMISASLSTILGSTMSLYNRAEMKSVLYNVSQKLHVALDNELLASRNLVLYQTAVQPKSLVDREYQYCMQKASDGYIYVYSFDPESNKIVEEHVLLSNKSYRGATVKEFYIKYDRIMDKVNYTDGTERNCWRILYITTTITKNGVDYTHTSTVRLYNMAVYGTELEIKLNSSARPYTPSSKVNVEFPFVFYYATQYFEV